jgi:hypothetical protein
MDPALRNEKGCLGSLADVRASPSVETPLKNALPWAVLPTSPSFFGIINEERAMTKTLVALVLIAGGILLVARWVDTDKPVPARLSPPTDADQISEARRVSPSMSGLACAARHCMLHLCCALVPLVCNSSYCLQAQQPQQQASERCTRRAS